MSCRRATSATLASSARLSSTIRAFSAEVHRRRRSGPESTVAVVMSAPLICKLTGTQAHARISSGRWCQPDAYFHTDFAVDWKRGKSTGLWYFDWTFVDHGPKIEY